jgi:cytoskeletal protein CcmA (bactofilin family)
MLRKLMQPTTAKSHLNVPDAPATETPKAAESVKAEEPQTAPKSAPRDEGNKLIVGPNIKLKGSAITDCEILVVEGRVEASMNSRDIRIAEGGVFSGKAEIDVAEIRGQFEGELTARKRLVIHSTGKVTGVIRYGAVMIEEGGIISGDVAGLLAETCITKTPEATSHKKADSSTEALTPREHRSQNTSFLARGSLGRGNA